MLRSVNPTWAEPKMKPRGAVTLFQGVKKYVESRMEKGAEVELAQIGPACDGMAALNFLSDVACCTSDCPPSSGPFVLANRKHGIPTLLSAAVARPFAGMSGEPTVVNNIVSGTGLTGRFFADVFGNLFEGRNYAYHAGQRVVRQPNGTPIARAPIGSQLEALVAGDVETGWGFFTNEGGPHSHHEGVRWNGAAWAGLEIRSSPLYNRQIAPLVYRYCAIGPSPHFCRTNLTAWIYWPTGGPTMPFVEEFDIVSAGYTAEKGRQSYGWRGRCATSGGGYRRSDFIVAAIEGYSPSAQLQQETAHYATDYEIWLTFRDPMTNELITHKRLTEVEGYASTFAARNASAWGEGAWRAGVQVRPAPDGTWIVSVFDGAKAWVYELVAPTVPQAENILPNPTFAGTLTPWQDAGLWTWSEDGVTNTSTGPLALEGEATLTPGALYEAEVIFSSPPSDGSFALNSHGRAVKWQITGDTGPMLFNAADPADHGYNEYEVYLSPSAYPTATATVRSITIRPASRSYRVNLLEAVTLRSGATHNGALRVVYL